MKKLFTLFFALVLSIGVKAQCPLTQAVDFSTIDHHGNEINLFEILDRGQYVTKTLWPDFSITDLYDAIIEYQSRDRRYGGVK